MNAMIGSSLLLGPEGYQISRSVRLRSSASAYFNRTLTTPTNQKKWTLSAWVKRGTLSVTSDIFNGAQSGTNDNYIRFTSGNALMMGSYNGAGTDYGIVTTAVFRDPSAYYHCVFVYDVDNATSTDRAIIYVNGVRQVVTNNANGMFPSGYTSAAWNTAVAHRIGSNSPSSTFADCYLTEINFIDGQALTPASFGETNYVTGVWQPKKYIGTYGTNGFYLNFSDNSAATAAAIGKDYSGNGNNWTPNNISVTAGVTYDSMLDVPTQWADGGNGRGNYAVLNPLLSAGGTTANGNLQVTTATGVGHSRATIAMPASGKWYAEFTAVSAATSTDYIFGIVGADTAEASYGYNQTPSYSYTAFGERVVNGTFTASFYSSYTTGDVIGCAVNLDANEITWYKNGTAQTAISITNGSYFWMVTDASGTRQITAAFNAGQRPFTYTPPSGFKALNTLNLPTPTILKGNQYFDATLWTGDNTARNITNSGAMQPDLVWVKSRSTAGTSHVLIDAVRGANLALQSDLTNAEATFASSVTGFNADGFAIGTSNQVNLSPRTYVGWQWKEGATQGFDIVTYTGTGAARTVSHSLGVAPSMMIVRNRSDGTVNWRVYHKSIGAANYLSLNLTNASAAASSVWNNTEPTSSVFSVANDGGSNGSGNNLVAYLFAEVAGFSKFGSYTGNGSSDGPFVFCGFRPRFIMVKRTDSTSNWTINDTSRDSYNVTAADLRANTSDAEVNPNANTQNDILSNGFKVRHTAGVYNANGGTYIFAAFAEHPFKNALAR